MSKNTEPADHYKTLKYDGVPWRIKSKQARVIAVGDVHGDIAAFACILRERELLDKSGRWTGENSHVVLNGDLVGGKNARLLLQFVLRLQQEARAAGGRRPLPVGEPRHTGVLQKVPEA